MPDGSAEEPASTELATMDPALAEQFAHMATMVPSEDGSGYERILGAILSAASWDKLSDPWEATNAEELRGKRLRIDSIMRRPSSFEGGLGVFLVVKSVDTKNGEAFIWTTSSVAIVAQLVRAYALRAYPIIAEVVVSKRPTERGFYPQHLHIIGASGPS